jgi:hypothetical protein
MIHTNYGRTSRDVMLCSVEHGEPNNGRHCSRHSEVFRCNLSY